MKILAVDDNKDTLQLLTRILNSHGEYVTADSGHSAISYFKQAHEEGSPFHLIFLDIMMPDINGHEVLKTIRSLEENNYPTAISAKIAMLTALGNPKNRFASYEEGCEFYLVKPIVKADIIDVIKKTKSWLELTT